METTHRFPAFLGYFLLILGCLYVFIFQRKDEFALYHAKQSLLIVLAALIISVVWVITAWLLSWLPFGFLLGMALFSLVLAAYLFLAAVWLLGIFNVSRAVAQPLPIIGKWAKWIPIN